MFTEHLERLKTVSKELQTRITSASAEDIAGILYSTSAVLTLDELDAVTKHCTNPSQKLMEILLQKSITPDEYSCFLDALKQKNLTDAYILLTLPGKIATTNSCQRLCT